MSLKLLTGGSGTGKSYMLYQDMISHALAHPNQNHIILVPEQYNLYTQQRLVALSPQHGIMNIEALSFERLAYRVFDELGTLFTDVLEDTGKSLLLRRICEEKRDELTVLSRGMEKPGFIDEIKSLISEFMQYEISPETLKRILSENNIGGSFKIRMADVELIYTSFLQMLKDKYITTEQILTLLKEVIDRSSFVKGAYIALDGYTGLTPVQNSLMEVMLPLAERVTVTITIDENESIYSENEYSLFSMSCDFAKSLIGMAERTGVETEDIIKLKNSDVKRFPKDSGLAVLQENIFRIKKDSKASYSVPSDIEIYALEEHTDELKLIAASIRKMIKEDSSLRYRDFAVLCPDMNIYRYSIESVFCDYDIPVFADTKDSLDKHRLIKLISAVLNIRLYGFTYEAVMSYLSCGYTGLEQDRIDRFDNYLLASGIRGKSAYKNGFKRLIDGMDTEDLEEINESRSIIYKVFSDKAFPKEASVREYTTSLYGIITDLDVFSQTNEEERSVYIKVMDLFDKLVLLLGDCKMSLLEYKRILTEGLSGLSLGVLPKSNDVVLFGDMERSRIGQIKVLFMMGMSDTSVPKRMDGGGLLLQSERQKLIDAGVTLAPTDRQKTFTQRFYLYLAMLRPSDKLFITYPLRDDEGQESGGCYLIWEIMDIFDGMKEKRLSSDDIRKNYCSDKTIADSLAGFIRNYIRGDSNADGRMSLMLSYLRENDKDAYERIMEAALYSYDNTPLQRAVANAIVPQDIRVSASKLERYCACAYSYYLEYELRLKERREHGIASSDLGNIYHDALRRYAEKLEESEYDWYDVSDEVSDEILDKSISEAYEMSDAAAAIDTERERYILHRMRETLRRSVWALKLQVRDGQFVPKGFEVKLSSFATASSVYELSEGRRLMLSGIIDRLDTYETDDTVYIKIIDYKSGDKDINLSDAYEGLQIQLLLYMNAVCEATKRQNPEKYVIPAALFYYQVKNPIVDRDKVYDNEALSEVIIKELKNKGLVCDNDIVIEALDKNIRTARENNERYASFNIPVSLNKNGSLAASSKVLDTEGMKTIGDYAAYKAIECGNDIVRGLREIKPYRHPSSQREDTACRFCPYHSVCGFDIKVDGFRYNDITPEKDNALICEKMKEKMKEDK